MWAPHVIENAGTYYMFYAAGGSGCAINLATSTDLFNWTRIPQGPVFRGLVARDPFVTRIGNQWVMYYCELANWQSNHIVAARTSTDLIHWSAPRTVFTDPSTDSNASVTESPVVVQRDGTYYLFIGPRFGYVGTDVFRSTDPFNFQLANYAGHVPAHAIEVVGDRVTGAGSFQHGIYLADLQWRSTPPVWHSPDNPAAGLNPQGAIELFALDNNHRIVRRVLPGDWELFSDEVTTVPTVGRNTDGRLELFTVAKDQGLIHRVQRADGTWGDWEVFGGAAGAAPAVSRNADGRLEVFALGPAGAYITHRWQNVPNGGWSSWDTGFGGPAAALSTVNRDGRGLLNVFALAPVSTGVHRRVQTVPSGGWAGWQLADSWADASARTAVNADGRLEMFCIPPGGAQITHRWQTTPTSGAWSNSEVFDSQPVAASPTVIVDASGRQHVFAVALDGVLRERIQLAPNSGWGPWRTLPGAPILPLPVGHPS
ncbi:family 43 glycosylhydrolase [Kribbella solani]|nr:family 43 glycosylhydrolase [Kribbella solani]